MTPKSSTILVAIVREIHIAARPAEVWKVLTEFPSYGEWNPHVTRAEGSPSTGSCLSITVTENGAGTDPPGPCRNLWPGAALVRPIPLPGIADGGHSIVLTPDGDGTLPRQEESFTGVLAPLAPFLFNIDVAGDLLDEYGWEHVSARTLADAVGMKAPSLYRHVHSRADLAVHL